MYGGGCSSAWGGARQKRAGPSGIGLSGAHCGWVDRRGAGLVLGLLGREYGGRPNSDTQGTGWLGHDRPGNGGLSSDTLSNC